MTTVEELPKAYEPTEVETRWYPRWMAQGLFTADPTSSKPSYCIVLPPPNVTGSLHLGHALTATIQDILIRWKRMSGFNCLWLPGMDHAGIATQMVVEKELKKTEGKSRHDLGRAAFLERVWAWKEKYGARIGEQHKVLGASLDWTRERFTMDEGLSKSVREVFVRLYEEGLIYRAWRLITWCPSCITALSDLEVDHTAEKGSMWHLAYPVDGTDVKLTVATTRPETMLGDTAVAIHPNDPRYLGLHGQHVRLPLVGRKIPIVLDAELVDMTFGTGVVKVTPGHDPNDYQTGLRHKLEQISIFDDCAVVNDNGGAYKGLDRMEARKKVLADLEAQGLLVKEEPHELNIGRCQRCHTVVEPMLSMQWFVKTKGLADTAMKAVDEGRTRFVPEAWTNTFRHWMTNIQDWCVSRQLWWGHQIPAWYPKDSPRRADGSIDVAKATPTVAREKPEGEWEQDPDVLDTWFSSGLWPFSTLGWPDQTPELKAFYPNSVMETGHDIIFFWVARMMMMGLHFMGDVPFRTVFLHAMVRDEKGDKMSKTKGNVIDPLDIVRGAEASALPPSIKNKFPDGLPPMGADALRFTLAALTQQGRDIKLSVDRIAGYKAFCNKLWNASRFALMNLGDYQEEPNLFIKQRALSLADRWILARLNKAIAGTNEALVGYHFSDAASTIYQFVWGEFCDWYIELAKGPLNGDDAQAKANTQAVLVFCLDQVLRLLHPFMPFITEEIWQKLPITRATESISVAPFPTADRRLEDVPAENEMRPIVEAIEGIRTIRGESNLNPGLKLEAHIHTASKPVRESLEKYRSYLMPLAGLSRLTVVSPGHKPPQAAADIRQDMEIYVPLAGIVDLAEERERLKKEIMRADQELASIKKKLSNPNFVQKAPVEVVEKDRAREAELTLKIAKMADNLKRIEPAEVRIAPPAAGTVNLGEELKDELSGVKVPDPDSQVKEALDKLREGTQEGLTSRDRYDLGVAYMNMGLVDDAVREFNKAKEGGEEGAEEAHARASGPRGPAAKGGAKPLPPAKGGAKKAAPRKAAKKPAPKKAAKKPAPKKAAKKAAPKKAAKKPAPKKAAKKPAPKKGKAGKKR